MTVQMTREKFQDIVNEIAGGPITKGLGKKTTYHDIEFLQEEWISGGMEGGNCWGDEPFPIDDIDPEPNGIAHLDTLLERVCPDISYLKYRRLESMFERNEHMDREYYGNYTITSSKSINIQCLWEYLTENYVIEEDM